MKLPLARLTSNLVPFGAASRVVLNSETRIRMAIMIEPWSCGELASEKVRAIYPCSRRAGLQEQNRRSARDEIRTGNRFRGPARNCKRQVLRLHASSVLKQ